MSLSFLLNIGNNYLIIPIVFPFLKKHPHIYAS